MLKILIISSFLCLGSAWNQPSTCYVRQSSSWSSSSEIQELRNYLETSLASISSTLEQLMDAQDCQVSTAEPTATTDLSPTTEPTPPPQIGTLENPATSCSEISADRPSGIYWLISNTTTSPIEIYCDTNRTSCSCNTTGGWMRVAYLDMTDLNETCPDGLRLKTRQEPPLRTCGRIEGPGCGSTTYSVYGVPYSQVCGRVIAYRDKTTDGFKRFDIPPSMTIDEPYVDGVSLTHGQSPRQHIWTFVAAFDGTRSDAFACPCTQSDQPYTGIVPPFIGNDYFCDTASRDSDEPMLYPDDPLWDGQGCGGTSTCCQFNNPPWFCKELPEPSTDDIELRICADESLSCQ